MKAGDFLDFNLAFKVAVDPSTQNQSLTPQQRADAITSVNCRFLFAPPISFIDDMLRLRFRERAVGDFPEGEDNVQADWAITDTTADAYIKNKLVTTPEIADGAVTAAKVANDVITTDKLQDGSITDVKLSDDAVGTDQISDNAVTKPKLSAALRDSIDAVATNTTNITAGRAVADAAKRIADLATIASSVAFDADERLLTFATDGADSYSVSIPSGDIALTPSQIEAIGKVPGL